MGDYDDDVPPPPGAPRPAARKCISNDPSGRKQVWISNVHKDETVPESDRKEPLDRKRHVKKMC